MLHVPDHATAARTPCMSAGAAKAASGLLTRVLHEWSFLLRMSRCTLIKPR